MAEIREDEKAFPFLVKIGEPFGFAGLYETWLSPEKVTIHTCTIITTEPNELIQPIHDRMPVIVKKELEDVWIDQGNQKELLAILQPYPSEDMMIVESKIDSL